MRFAQKLLGISLLTSVGLAWGGSPPAQAGKSVPTIEHVSGYSIRVVRLERNSYGYEIRRGSQVVVHQRRNPYTGSLQGLQSSTDAQKTANWVLENLVKADRMRPSDRRPSDENASFRFIPSSVAAQLGVTLDRTR
jgi:hypothetical protein